MEIVNLELAQIHAIPGNPTRLRVEESRHQAEQSRFYRPEGPAIPRVRNVVIHGIRFRAYPEVVMSLTTSLIGAVMLLLPCLWTLCPFISGISSTALRVSAGFRVAIFLHAFLSRLRYVGTASAWLGIRFPRRVVLLIPAHLLVDFLAWTIPLGQYPVKILRDGW